MPVSKILFVALFSLGVLLSACGSQTDGIRGGLDGSVGSTTNTQNSLYSTGQFGCTATTSRSEVQSGEIFTVVVTVFNATGTPTLASGRVADSNGVITYTTSYLNTGANDLLWSPSVQVEDGTSVAQCSFQIYVTPQAGRRL